MLRLLGIRPELPGLGDDEDEDDLLDVFGDNPGLALLKNSIMAVVDIIGQIQDGASDDELDAALTKHAEKSLVAFDPKNTKDFMLKGLEESIQRGDEHQMLVFHELIVQQHLGRQDWQGLCEYLDLVFAHERSLPLNQLKETELELVGSWHFLRGVCEMELGDFENSLKNLLKALDIACRHGPLMDLLQFKALLMISKLKMEHSIGPWPAWDSLLRALVLAYTPGYQAFYARNGTIFNDVFKVVQVEAQSQLSELEFLKTFDTEQMNQFVNSTRERAIREGHPIMVEVQGLQDLVDELAAKKARFQPLVEGGIQTPEKLNREIDTACLILGSIMQAANPLDVKGYSQRTYSAHQNVNRRTSEDLEIIHNARAFLGNLWERITQIMSDEEERDEEDQQKPSPEIMRLLEEAEQHIFLKQG